MSRLFYGRKKLQSILRPIQSELRNSRSAIHSAHQSNGDSASCGRILQYRNGSGTGLMMLVDKFSRVAAICPTVELTREGKKKPLTPPGTRERASGFRCFPLAESITPNDCLFLSVQTVCLNRLSKSRSRANPDRRRSTQ